MVKMRGNLLTNVAPQPQSTPRTGQRVTSSVARSMMMGTNAPHNGSSPRLMRMMRMMLANSNSASGESSSSSSTLSNSSKWTNRLIDELIMLSESEGVVNGGGVKNGDDSRIDMSNSCRSSMTEEELRHLCISVGPGPLWCS